MQADIPGASCFGKLPTHGDFLRYNASGRAMQAFDAWVQQGIVEAQRLLGQDLIPAFEQAGTTCFFFDAPNAPHVLAGALRPSRDRSGRRYPFLVAVEVEKRTVEGRRMPGWPDRYERFFRAAALLVDDAVDGRLEEGDLPERLAFLRAIHDATPFAVDYEFRLRQASAHDLWARTWGDAEDGRKYVLLKNLTETFGAASSGRSAKLPGALDIPLAPTSRGLDVSFWLEVCWHLLGSLPDYAAVFWTAPSATKARMLVASAPPPAAAFPYLLRAAPGPGVHVLDDAAGQPTALAALALPAQYGTLLEDDALTLHAFIHRLTS
jgi:type VI secretion system ImpM family protein